MFVVILFVDGDLVRIVVFLGVGGFFCLVVFCCIGLIVCVKFSDFEILFIGVIGLGIREGVEGLLVGVVGCLILVVLFVGWFELDVIIIFVDFILLFLFCLDFVFLLFFIVI